MRKTLIAASALVLGLSTAACGADTGGGDDTSSAATPSGPTTLQPVPVKAAAGTQRVTCEVSTPDGPVDFAFDLPDGFRVERKPCRWRSPAPKGVDPGYPTLVSVTYEKDADALGVLNDDIAPDEDIGGDDSISDLDYRHDTQVFGRTIGDRISWDCFCDGQARLTYEALADGILLQVTGSSAIQDRATAWFEAMLANAGTAR